MLRSGRRINNRRLVVPFEMIRREVKRFVAFISIFILSELLRCTGCNFVNFVEIYEWNRALNRNAKVDTSGLHDLFR